MEGEASRRPGKVSDSRLSLASLMCHRRRRWAYVRRSRGRNLACLRVGSNRVASRRKVSDSRLSLASLMCHRRRRWAYVRRSRGRNLACLRVGSNRVASRRKVSDSRLSLASLMCRRRRWAYVRRSRARNLACLRVGSNRVAVATQGQRLSSVAGFLDVPSPEALGVRTPKSGAEPCMPPGGFEPPTSALGKPCSIQLSYEGGGRDRTDHGSGRPRIRRGASTVRRWSFSSPARSPAASSPAARSGRPATRWVSEARQV